MKIYYLWRSIIFICENKLIINWTFTGEAAAYIVSQGTTFRWDTCAPHAIIRAIGGDLLSYKNYTPITYNDEKDLETKEYCNKDGIIAYCSDSVLNELKSIIS